MKLKLTTIIGNALVFVAVLSMIGLVDNVNAPVTDVDKAWQCLALFVTCAIASVVFRKFYYIKGYLISRYILYRFQHNPEKFDFDSLQYLLGLLHTNRWSIHRTCKYMAEIYYVNIMRME